MASLHSVGHSKFARERQLARPRAGCACLHDPFPSSPHPHTAPSLLPTPSHGTLSFPHTLTRHPPFSPHPSHGTLSSPHTLKRHPPSPHTPHTAPSLLPSPLTQSTTAQRRFPPRVGRGRGTQRRRPARSLRCSREAGRQGGHVGQVGATPRQTRGDAGGAKAAKPQLLPPRALTTTLAHAERGGIWLQALSFDPPPTHQSSQWR